MALEVIAEATDHSSTTVTKRYAHLSSEYKRQDLVKMVPEFHGPRMAHGADRREDLAHHIALKSAIDRASRALGPVAGR